MDRHIFFKKCKTKQFTDNEIFSQNLQEKNKTQKFGSLLSNMT